MNYLIYFYILIIVLCWTFNPFIKKVLLNKIGKPEYMVINHSFKEEQRVKIESISFIREHKNKLKRVTKVS